MNRFLMRAAALCALLVAPSIADAAVRGFATANVNMRSGPSTGYPAVTVIPYGAPVTIYGCLSSVNWCDVAFVGGRGWVSGRYVQANYRSNRVYVEPDYYPRLGIPTITFDVDTYWDRNYRDRNFYRERDRWRRYDWDRAERRPPPPNWERERDRNRGDWDRDRDRNREWERDRDRDRAREEMNRERERDRDRDRAQEERRRDRDQARDQRQQERDRAQEERRRERDQAREQRRDQQSDRERELREQRQRNRAGIPDDSARPNWPGNNRCAVPGRDC